MSIQLAPDIEADIRAAAALRGVSVDVLIREALDAIRGKTAAGNGGKFAKRLADHTARLDWMKEHRAEYVGRWVVFDGLKFIGADFDAKRLYKTARAQGVKTPAITFIEPEDSRPFAGW